MNLFTMKKDLPAYISRVGSLLNFVADPAKAPVTAELNEALRSVVGGDYKGAERRLQKAEDAMRKMKMKAN